MRSRNFHFSPCGRRSPQAAYIYNLSYFQPMNWQCGSTFSGAGHHELSLWVASVANKADCLHQYRLPHFWVKYVHHRCAAMS